MAVLSVQVKKVSLYPITMTKGLEADEHPWAKQLFAENHLIELNKKCHTGWAPSGCPKGLSGDDLFAV